MLYYCVIPKASFEKKKKKFFLARVNCKENFETRKIDQCILHPSQVVNMKNGLHQRKAFFKLSKLP